MARGSPGGTRRSDRPRDAGEQRDHLLQALLSPQVWLLCAIYFCTATGSYGFTFWLPSILVAFHAEAVEDYVRRRHARLKTYGAKNPEIFARIASDIACQLSVKNSPSPETGKRSSKLTLIR